jgi:hypothetical protein
VKIDAGASMVFAPGIGGVSTQGLSVDPAGIVDITNNHLLINYASGTDPAATIAQYLASGYNGGAWNGPGIDSSTAAVNSNYGVGYADSANPGNPAGLSSSQIEVKYTLYGDSNLDGVVNSVDFGTLAANFGKSGKIWDQGDFDYNGTVNSSDFGSLAANFGKSVGGNAAVVSAADWDALYAFAASEGLTSMVPEPISASAMLIAGAGILARRRRSGVCKCAADE